MMRLASYLGTGAMALTVMMLSACVNSTLHTAASPNLRLKPHAVFAWDKKFQVLRQQLQQQGIDILDPDDSSHDIVLLLPSAIQFKTGSANLTSSSQRLLDGIALVMKTYPYSVAEIPGHADAVGSKQANKKLSLQRATRVTHYLAAKGIARTRLVPIAKGEEKPLLPNLTAAGRELNRRVEVIIHQPDI